jgi:hypothetical protein
MGDSSMQILSGATLDHIGIDWRNGIARAQFLPSPTMKEAYALRFTGLVEAEITRSAKASRFVREVRRTAASDDAPVRVEIMLETGECLRFVASSVALDPIGG